MIKLLLAAALAVAASATPDPIFHVSPAGCGGGWMNDPNGPFEYRGVHHLFYQWGPPGAPPGPGPGGRTISWGHVAGNISHWTCLPAALAPGVDGDGARTPYDNASAFTGSATVVNGTNPTLQYIAMPGSRAAQAFPMDHSDPLLTHWRKDPRNPLDAHAHGPAHDTLGCTAAWRDSSTSNYTSTIEGGRAVQFWGTGDFVDWYHQGDLALPGNLSRCVVPCSDVYPAPGNSSEPGLFVFGINSKGCGLAAGGGVVGYLRPEGRVFDVAAWSERAAAVDVARDARYFAYDFGAAKYPKGYLASDGRRIHYAWLDEPAGANAKQAWQGAQTLPRVVTLAARDDPTASLVVYPAAEVAALRGELLVAAEVRGNGSHWIPLPPADGEFHLDVLASFQNWTGTGPVGVEAAGFAYTWTRRGHKAGHAVGTAAGPGGEGPLAVREDQRLLELRVLADGSVGEAFFDRGRARVASRLYSERGGLSVMAPAGSVATVKAWRMGPAWLPVGA
eukprot:g994.t1